MLPGMDIKLERMFDVFKLTESIDKTQQLIVKCQDVYTDNMNQKWKVIYQMMDIIKGSNRCDRCQNGTSILSENEMSARPILMKYAQPSTVRNEDYETQQNATTPTGEVQEQPNPIAKKGQDQSEERQSSESSLHSPGETVKSNQPVNNAVQNSVTESSELSPGTTDEAIQTAFKDELNPETVTGTFDSSTQTKRNRKKRQKKRKESKQSQIETTKTDQLNTVKMAISKEYGKDEHTTNDAGKNSSGKEFHLGRDHYASEVKEQRIRAKQATRWMWKSNPSADVAKSSDSMVLPEEREKQLHLKALLKTLEQLEKQLHHLKALIKETEKQLNLNALPEEIENLKAYIEQLETHKHLKVDLKDWSMPLLLNVLPEELEKQLHQTALLKTLEQLEKQLHLKGLSEVLVNLEENLHLDLESVFSRVNPDQRAFLSLLFSLWTYNMKDVIDKSDVVTIGDVVRALEVVSARMITSANIFPETIRMFVHFVMLNTSAEGVSKCGKGKSESSFCRTRDKRKR